MKWMEKSRAHWGRVAIYRFNVAVNNLLGKDIGRKDGGKHCRLISLQRWHTGLMHDKVADEARGFKARCVAIVGKVNLGRMVFVHMKVFDNKHRHECYNEHPCKSASEVFVSYHVLNFNCAYLIGMKSEDLLTSHLYLPCKNTTKARTLIVFRLFLNLI